MDREPGGSLRQTGFRPLMILSNTTTIAMTSRMWMKPPTV